MPITPLNIGPYLLPFGEGDVTTYGLATGVAVQNIDSYGIFVPVMGTSFIGRNYGMACSLVCLSEEFNGIAVGAIDYGNHNGISIFPIDFGSGTNGLSVEGITIGKGFNGIDFCLCNIYGTEGAGLQVIGLDFSTHDDSEITGCQIGGILTSAVRGAQIGAVTYNPKVGINRGRSFGKCLNLGVMNLDLTEGFQVGVVNNTSEGNPVQIGLFNTSFDGSPFQIGILNINPNGFLPIFPFFNYSVKKGAYEREQESAVGF
ncbi:MAG: hypothetical protein J6Y92_06100 [Lentisphaeria bacterium]|nr:hypothetical protein [Lentisphaeria bacterium]